VLNENDVIEVVLITTSSCVSTGSVTSAPLVIHFTSAPSPSVSITSPATGICAGTPLTFTATPMNGGSNPIYQWYINNIPAGPNNAVFITSSLNNNDQVKVVLTSATACATTQTATSNVITVTVSPVAAPSVSISANQSAICSGATVNFTAIPTNGGANPVYQWKRNGNDVGTNSATYSSNALSNGDIISCVMTSSSTCVTSPNATSNNITVTVNAIPATPGITANGALSFCAGGSVTLTSSAAGGNQWYKNGGIINGATGVTYIANASGLYTVVSTVGGCASATSTGITVTVNDLPSIPVITAVGNQLTTATGMTGYQWYLNSGIIGGATSNVYTPTASGLYTVEVTNAAGCKATSAAFNFSITAVGDVTVNGVQINCFPIPTSRDLHIRLSALPVDKPLAQLVDNTGRVVMEVVLTQRLQTIDVSRLAGGVYILNIIGKRSKGTIKVEVIR
ncbi:MAG TPA: T9SS type A sorting domain-containing protein, partial [Chitinophagaceae bacterium]|nr:T9SS type A sorting domain-containing protein [Chitinophagaceae bacterium]